MGGFSDLLFIEVAILMKFKSLNKGQSFLNHEEQECLKIGEDKFVCLTEDRIYFCKNLEMNVKLVKSGSLQDMCDWQNKIILEKNKRISQLERKLDELL